MTDEKNRGDGGKEIEQLAQERELSLLQEFVLFLRQNKKWWLIPLLLALALYGLFLAISLTGGIVSIYTLF